MNVEGSRRASMQKQRGRSGIKNKNQLCDSSFAGCCQNSIINASQLLTGLLAILFALTPLSIAQANQQPDARPNVIVILTDDQGYGDLSCHGNPVLQTPNLDQLASESVCFNDFHVAPMCTPTRGQLMSGLDAFRNGAMNVSSGRTLLRPELKTLPAVFKDAGYQTGIFGKWHLGDNYPFRPVDRGFEETLWFPSSHVNAVPDYWDNDYFDDTYIHNGERKTYEGYCTDIFFNEAMHWIKERPADQPFFAYIPTNAPHWPHFVPDKYKEMIEPLLAEHANLIEDLPDNRRDTLLRFLAMIANIDENVGRLDRFLEAQDLKSNTIVVYMTDNGSTMGADYFNAGMRGKKTQLWEGGHRVPCFVRWPQGELRVGQVDGLTQVQDIFPTLCELAGIADFPQDLDGISLAGTLRSGDAIPERMLVINYSRMPSFRVSYSDTPHIPAREGAVVLWNKWRFLEDQRLYNLKEDPHQDVDVAAQNPDVVAKMRKKLDEWWSEVEPIVMEPQRVIIGSSHENPMMLTACEWLDVFVDQQVQIRAGVRKNGIWHLEVSEPGLYRFELRRWPRESELPLVASLPPTKVTDGQYRRGVSLPIASARIEIGGIELQKQIEAEQQEVSFDMELKQGNSTLQTWFIDEDQQPISGAYYVYVARIEE